MRFLQPSIDFASGVVYAFRDDFTTASSAEPSRADSGGTGRLTLVQTDGELSVTGGKLTVNTAQASAAWGELGFIGPAITRAAGTVMIGGLNVSATSDFRFAFSHGTFGGTYQGFYPQNLSLKYYNIEGSATIDIEPTAGMSAGVDEAYALIMRAAGQFVLFKPNGGSWTLLFVQHSNTQTPLYPTWDSYDAAVNDTLDYIKVTAASAYSPTPLASDSFDRADSSSLGNTDGAGAEESGGDGLAWTQVNTTATAEIVSNKMKCTDAGSSPECIYTVATSSADVVLQGTVNIASSASGLIARAVDEDNLWLLHVNVAADESSIFERNTATWTKRANTSVTINAATDYDLLFVCDGTSLVGYVDGGNRITYTSSFQQTETDHGVRIDTVNGTVDNFVVWPRTLTDFDPDSFTDFQLEDNFTDAESAPLGRTVEPYDSTNRWSVTENDGTVTVAGGALTFTAQSTPTWGDLGCLGSTVTRAAGVVVSVTTGLTGSEVMPLAINNAAVIGASNNEHVFYLNATQCNARNAGLSTDVADIVADDTQYQMAVVLRATGAFFFINGGAFTSWTLLWIDASLSAATLYLATTNLSAAATIDTFRVTEAGYWTPTPLASDSFDRGDSSDLGSTDGAGAEESGGSGLAWTEDNGDWEIATNTCRVASGEASATVDAGDADVIVQASIVADIWGSEQPGLTLRSTDKDNRWFSYQDSVNFRIYERNAGVNTMRATVAYTPANGEWVDYMLISDGQTITGYANSANRISVSSAFNQTATRHGLSAWTSTQTEFNNFVVWPRRPSAGALDRV